MIRSTPVYVQSKENHVVGDCSTNGDSTSGGTFYGSIIDLQAFRSRFTHIQPVIAGTLPGVTSTAGASRVSLDVVVQSGNSSGGGDMANYSTEELPSSAQNYFSTAMSTSHPSWSTGTIRTQYSPEPITLLGTKRYVRVGGQVTRIGNATSTAAANLWTGHLGVNLLNAGEEGPTRNLAVMPGGNYQTVAGQLTTATTT